MREPHGPPDIDPESSKNRTKWYFSESNLIILIIKFS